MLTLLSTGSSNKLLKQKKLPPVIKSHILRRENMSEQCGILILKVVHGTRVKIHRASIKKQPV